MKRLSAMALLLIATSVTATAQQGQNVTTTVQGTPAQPGVPVGEYMTNVKIDLAITDQIGTGQPVRKTITLIVAGRGQGRVRSTGMVYQTTEMGGPLQQPRPLFEVTLNADATISSIVNDRVRASITVQYSPAGNNPVNEAGRLTPLNQSVDVVLQSGKPLIIAQASDPTSDRKVTLEATATILR